MDKERIIVGKILAGDMQAFRLLMKQNERLVLHIVGRVLKNQADIEEICQDVFMKVYQNLPKFKFESKLSTWIGTIAYHLSLNQAKKKGLSFQYDFPDDEEKMLKESFVEHSTPSQISENEELKVFLDKEIERLPNTYRLIITLYHTDQLSYPEICKITGLPEGTVKSYLFRARAMLKEKLKKHYQFHSFF